MQTTTAAAAAAAAAPHSIRSGANDAAKMESSSAAAAAMTNKTPSSQKIVSIEQYDFPFENIVFEGGSNKLLAYCGAIRILEEIGIWKKMKRIAGTGSGSVVATLCAVGYTSQQMEELFQDDLKSVITENSAMQQACCIGCNMSRFYGLDPNERISKWIGKKLQESFGNSNATFSDIYKKLNKEIVIAITNVRQNSLELCHFKTTPEMSVKEAVRMSLTVPGLGQPVRNKLHGRVKDIFVGGGIICNYPVNCFDGWWLSMKPEDSFLRRLENIADFRRQMADDDKRFGSYNNRTIGVIVFNDSSIDNSSSILSARINDSKQKPNATDSLLRGIREKSKKDNEVLHQKYSQFISSAVKFIKLVEKEKTLNKKNINDLLNKSVLTDNDLTTLFDRNPDADKVWREISNFGQEKVTLEDLWNYFERKRRFLEADFSRDQSYEINSLTDYFKALNETIERNNGKRFGKVQKRDLDRTVGISTGHVHAWDKGETLELADRQFIIQQGKAAMRAFLEHYVTRISKADAAAAAAAADDDDKRKSFYRDDLRKFIDDDVSEIIDEQDYMETYLERVH